MSYKKSYTAIYPKITSNEWRLQSCFGFEKQIQEDVEKYSSSLTSMKKKEKKVKRASYILTASATILSGGGIITTLTGVGAVIGMPIAGVGAVIGGFSAIPLKMEKNISEEILKYEKLLTAINSSLSIMRQNINKYLKDDNISEEEYKYIEYEYNEYKKNEAKMLASSSTKSAKKDQFAKEVMEKIVEHLDAAKK